MKINKENPEEGTLKESLEKLSNSRLRVYSLGYQWYLNFGISEWSQWQQKILMASFSKSYEIWKAPWQREKIFLSTVSVLSYSEL